MGITDFNKTVILDYANRIKDFRSQHDYLASDKLRDMLAKHQVKISYEKPNTMAMEWYDRELLPNGVYSPRFNIERITQEDSNG